MTGKTPFYSLQICGLSTLLYVMGRPATFTTQNQNAKEEQGKSDEVVRKKEERPKGKAPY
jgi:hypothetical protein